MSVPRLVIVAFALLATACSAKASGPPEIEVDRTACSHCGMFVSEPVYAAAYQVQGREPRVFDDIGCLLNAIRAESASPITVWLQDAAGSGWIAAGEASFVASPHIRTPMSGGVLAYADAAAAEKAVQANGGLLLRSLPELMSWHGETR